MGITLGSNFTVNTGLPLDDRTVVADLTERDALDLGRRYEGLEVFVRTELKTYQLQGGIGNVNWVESGGTGGGAIINVDTFAGDGTITTFTLSADPVLIENTTVFVDGVYQKKTDAYTLVGLDIVFSQAPPQNTVDPNNIEVIYTTPATPLVIPNGSITKTKLAALGHQISSSSGFFTLTGTTSITDVTNLSVTITTTGRPVFVGLIADGSNASFFEYNDTNTAAVGNVYIYRDAGAISFQQLGGRYGSTSAFQSSTAPTSSLYHIDTPSAGTYTYKVRVQCSFATASWAVYYAKLVAYEL